MTCEGLGMPFHKTPYKYGNLFINFKVKFPDTLETDQIDKIQKVLSNQKPKSDSDLSTASETVQLVKFEEHHKHPDARGEVDPDEE